jgi:K+-transporting ATPase ATPase A chain
MLGTNGGGFFNANSAHPFENPTPLSNFVEMLSIFTLGAGLTYMFDRFAGDARQGWTLFAAMLILFLAGVTPLGLRSARAENLRFAEDLGDGGMPTGRPARERRRPSWW